MRSRMVVGAMGVLAAAACASHFRPLDLDALPGRETWPDAEAAILQSLTRVEFRPGAQGRPAARRERWSRVRILGEQGRDRARLREWFKTGHSEVVRFDARLLTPAGEVKKRSLGQALERASYPSFVLYADHRILELDLTPAPLGSVVEAYSVTEQQGADDLSFGHVFGDLHPTVHERFEVIVPEGWEVVWSAEEAGRPIEWAPVREQVAEGTRLVWEVRELPAIRPEPHAPPVWWLARQVVVRLVRWDERGAPREGLGDVAALAARHWRDYRDNAVAGPAVRAKVEALLAGVPDEPAARARALFEWVRDQVPYCAVSIGDGDWRPHPAERILDVRYGDCKDKATLLHTMLGLAGIPSRPALVWAHDGYPRAFRLDRLGQNFNHVVVQLDLPSGPVVVDPTARHSAFGKLPAGDQGAEVLPLSPEDARLVTLPVGRPETNRWSWSAEGRIGADGAAEGTFALEVDGLQADELRERLFAHAGKDRQDAFARALDLTRVIISGTRFEGTRPDPDRPLRAEGTLTLPGLLVGAGRTRMLRPAAFLEPVVPTLPARPRKSPLVLPAPGRHVVEMVLTLPEGASVASLPPPAEHASSVGRYRLSWSLDADGRLRLRRELVRLRRIVPAGETAAARAFFEAVHAAESRPVVLELP